MAKKPTTKKIPKKRKPAPKSQGAPKGNQFWKARSSHGRKPIFKTPYKLWTACCQYFQWVEDNPLKEAIVYQGKISKESKSLMRAMTESGLCIFLDIGTSTWYDYKQKKAFSEVTTRVEEIIYTQKFTGAAADQLNPNIIARDLGLKDTKAHELSGPGGGPVQTITKEMSEKEAARIYTREVLESE